MCEKFIKTTFKLRRGKSDVVDGFVAANHGLRGTYGLMQSLASRKKCTGGTIGVKMMDRSMEIVRGGMALVRAVQNEAPLMMVVDDAEFQTCVSR